ncbi:hypothetical protein CCH79_00015625 [Gambusia affinis]|uniref:Uncharacterized protein n=1 Tax=Gambusia affinis TaxID=33528 RepID=A0A315VEY3_GAMAF|nr:hypothetical protein CCH79_00015625 [Gambusia affinis]
MTEETLLFIEYSLNSEPELHGILGDLGRRKTLDQGSQTPVLEGRSPAVFRCATDIRDSKISTASEAETSGSLWTASDNSFRFNFNTDNDTATPPPQEEAPAAASLSFSGQSSAFAFNFQIPPAEDMDTTEATKPASLLGNQQKGPSCPQGGATTCEASDQTKTKKKKKSGKKKPSDSEAQQKLTEENQEELSPEEQLNRELNWCIEQLELGIKSQKGTPKQKEEASRALKTLRSSKAPLVKKRQLMRALTGDYRKKMEEEKNKQFQLIQSETASAQVKVVSDSPKKSVFHRRAEASTGPGASQTQQQQQRRTETPAFSFVPSQEEFHFNFF